jgi:SAM-dependent methyltransferase
MTVKEGSPPVQPLQQGQESSHHLGSLAASWRASSQQTKRSQELNRSWFADNEDYTRRQEALECYRNIRRCAEHEIAGVEYLLDIGNGGFFNYDTALVGQVTAVDLFLEDGPGPRPNILFRQGSFLDIPCPAESFDCVLQQNVLHHVVGATPRQNHANLKRCLAEMYRCLRPGGKAVLIESTVGPLFYCLEWLAFTPLTWIRRGGHPVTFQYTARHLIRAAQDCGFQIEEFTWVPRGAFLLQFGHVWPSCLTPARPVKLVLTR